MGPDPAPATREMGPVDAEQILLPGHRDAARLTGVWLARRACTGILFVGVIVGIVVAGPGDGAAELELDTASAESVLGGILTSFGLVFLAIVLRLLAGWAALALAAPLARAHQGELDAHPGLRRRAAIAFDRLAIARAFRELRWTEGVRAAALGRLGDAAPRYERLDRLIGVANVAAVVGCIPAMMLFGFEIEM